MSEPPALPALREVIRQYGLSARRSLGQNFLLDGNLIARIARAARPLAGVNVIEIGPGPGGLTRALLQEGAQSVTVVERDDRCIAALTELAATYPGRLIVIADDAMAFDTAKCVAPPRKIVANLPYNIATALLLRWLPGIGEYQSLTLMFQKEVAARLTAKPRSKDYGRLSVLVQWLCEITVLFDVRPSAFVPPPKVTSSLVRIVPRAEPLAACARSDLERVTAAAFGQRRKMLRQSLKPLGLPVEELLRATTIAPERRAEELSVEEFCALARTVAAIASLAGD
jgi:16S rRNA (adenine1518-N6/adenine1519-N6)-dimethyltransferase